VNLVEINPIVTGNNFTTSLRLLVNYSGGFDTPEFDYASGVFPIETKMYSNKVTGVIQTFTINNEIVKLEFNVDAE